MKIDTVKTNTMKLGTVNTITHAFTALITLTLVTTSTTIAHAEPPDDPLSRLSVTYDYLHRTTTGVEARDNFATATGERRTSEQSIHALGFHVILWRPQNQTLLGHLPAITMDALAGYMTEDPEQSPGEETGGGIFGFKSAFPWSLVDLGWLRFGAGLGFGIIYELGSADPQLHEYHGLDFDLAFNATAEVVLPGDFTLRLGYDRAFFGVMYESQHRLRALVDWEFLTAGVDARFTDMGQGAGYDQIGGSVGFEFY